jgi:hypothetical protein
MVTEFNGNLNLLGTRNYFSYGYLPIIYSFKFNWHSFPIKKCKYNICTSSLSRPCIQFHEPMLKVCHMHLSLLGKLNVKITAISETVKKIIQMSVTKETSSSIIHNSLQKHSIHENWLRCYTFFSPSTICPSLFVCMYASIFRLI